MKTMRRVFVNGRSYPVRETPTYLKASLNGIMGWISIWADDYTAMVRRIKLALRGGQ